MEEVILELRERLAALARQYASLGRQLSAVSNENDRLRAQFSAAVDGNYRLREENASWRATGCVCTLWISSSAEFTIPPELEARRAALRLELKELQQQIVSLARQSDAARAKDDP